jgi:hypothetical protein
MWYTKSLGTVLAAAVGSYLPITFSYQRIKSAHFYFQLVFTRGIDCAEPERVQEKPGSLPWTDSVSKLFWKLFRICSSMISHPREYGRSRMLTVPCPFIFRETRNDDIGLKFPDNPDNITQYLLFIPYFKRFRRGF